ncbi:hypothetical protein ABK040_008855 [Willaertia magna]
MTSIRRKGRTTSTTSNNNTETIVDENTNRNQKTKLDSPKKISEQEDDLDENENNNNINPMIHSISSTTSSLGQSSSSSNQSNSNEEQPKPPNIPTDNPIFSLSNAPTNQQRGNNEGEEATNTTKRKKSTKRTTKKKKKDDMEDDEADNLSNSTSNSVIEGININNLQNNQRLALSLNEIPPNQHSRIWILEYPIESLPLVQQGLFSDVQVRVTMKIRGEEAKYFVPEKLYSSHKYVILHEITGETLLKNFPLIVSKIHVINPMSREELRNSKNSNKLCLQGTMETALTKSTKSTHNEDMIKGQMKIQFTDVSYHHEKGAFGFLIHYFNPSNLDKPIFSLVSPAFRVYARKPTNDYQTETLQPSKPKPSKRKRKKSDTSIQPTQDQTEENTNALTNTSGGSDNTNNATEATNPPPEKKKKKKTTPVSTNESTTTNTSSTNPVECNSVVANLPIVNAPEQPTMTSTTSNLPTQISPNFEEFLKKLDRVAAIKDKLSQENSRKASELALMNLLAIDNNVAIDFFLNQNPQLYQQLNNMTNNNNNRALEDNLITPTVNTSQLTNNNFFPNIASFLASDNTPTTIPNNNAFNFENPNEQQQHPNNGQ